MITELFNEPNNFLIIGKRGSSKTSLGFKILQESADLSGRKAYVFRFPKPELLKKLPFKVCNLTDIKQLRNITDGICLIDEAHRYFSVLNKMVNNELQEILANSRQNNTGFIFITHNSYFITRGLFSYIDVRIIKEVPEGHWDTERTHMRALYRTTSVIGNEWFYLDCADMKGMERFDKPEYYTEEFSTAYRNVAAEHGKDFFQKLRENCGLRGKSADVLKNKQKVRISAEK